MPHESQVVGWPGRTLFDADGSKVGKIEDVFADERTGRPAWATVSSGLFGRRHHFVPIENAREVEDGVAVPVAGQLVKGAPNVDADGDLSRDDERTLYRHYGLDDGELDGTDAVAPGATAVDADHDGRDDRTEHDARGDHAEDDEHAARGYAHHDERTRHDADGDGRDDRGTEGRHDADGRDDRTEGHGTTTGAAAAAASAGGAHRAGTHDDDLGGPASHDAGPSDAEHAPHRERRDDHDGVGVVRDHDRGTDDDARGSGVPPTLQADATTEALARAERERLAAAEAEHDRLAARQAERPAYEPAPPAHEPAVLDRELAQQDLSVAPTGDDRHVGGLDRDPAATDGSGPTPDTSHAARIPGRDESGTDRPEQGESAFDRPAQGDHDRASGGSTPSVGTRLRRLARSITPSSKDDHHG